MPSRGAATGRHVLKATLPSRWQPISAALGLSWRERVEAKIPIDVPCLDLGGGRAQFVILPAAKHGGQGEPVQWVK